MIQKELDIFAADKTGMPDFALQSMGRLYVLCYEVLGGCC